MYGDTCLYTVDSLNNTKILLDATKYITFKDKDKKDNYFNIDAYKKRLQFVFEPFFLDANERSTSNKIYCHVVYLGLGFFETQEIIKEQKKLYIDALLETLLNLSSDNNTQIPNIEYVDLSQNAYNKDKDNNKFTDLQQDTVTKLKTKGIIVFHSFNNPSSKEKIVPEKKKFTMANHTLVAMYKWDSNAYAGNKYYNGNIKHVKATYDLAAACCSTISFLQNPSINPHILESTSYASGFHYSTPPILPTTNEQLKSRNSVN
jgi:hypothetical protein